MNPLDKCPYRDTGHCRAKAFCRRFDLERPILLAEMARGCPLELSAAVANAGGIDASGVLLT